MNHATIHLLKNQLALLQNERFLSVETAIGEGNLEKAHTNFLDINTIMINLSRRIDYLLEN